MSILIINNYFQPQDSVKVKAIEYAIRLVGEYKVIIWSYSEVGKKGLLPDLVGVILSGSSAHLPDDYKKFEAEIEFIRLLEVPVLGICFGHQLIGVAFGSGLSHLDYFIRDFNPLEIVEANDIFYTWQTEKILYVSQYHKDCLAKLPENFSLLAKSDSCPIEAMKHKERPIYGIQAHVERYTWEHSEGLQILKNFLEKVVNPYKMSKILAKPFIEIKQSIIDALRDIEYDVVRGDYEAVESKLKEAQLFVNAWQLKILTGVVDSI